MDSVLALALCSLGVFIGVCATAIFYISIVRPNLLQAEFVADIAPQMGGGTYDFGAIEDKLNQLLQQHEEQTIVPPVPSATVAAPPDLASSFQALEERLNMQRKQLHQMTALLTAEISAHGQTLQAILDQLDKQESQLQQIKAMPVPPANLDQANTHLSDLIKSQEALLLDQIERLKQLDVEIKQSSALENEQKSMLEILAHQVADIDGDINVIKAKKRPVRLTDIKGIGPKYAALLYEAGIENFHQLAAMNPDDLRQLLRAPKRFKMEAWIAEAKFFAAEQEKVEANS